MGAIGVWILRDTDRLCLEDVVRRLPTPDRTRLEAMRDASRARGFAAGRLASRTALAELLGDAAWRVGIVRDALGRPCADGVSFSVSHAGSWAAAALSLDSAAREVGIGCDLEPLRPRPGLERLVERVLTRDERAAVLAAGEADVARAFYRLWCRKEACLKAVGGGLSRMLAGFSVARSPAQVPGAATPVYYCDVAADSRIALAVAQTAPVGRVECRGI